jgi:hypothetical protein
MEIIVVYCGIPFFFIALGLWFVGTSYWPNQFKITYVPFLNNEIGSFLFAVVVLLIPILGCCTGYLLLPKVTSAFEMSEEGWVLLEKPPQDIKTLRAADFHTVYGETIDGQLISCYYESAYDNNCWREVSELPEIRAYGNCSGWNVSFPEPPSSVNIIDRIDIKDCMTFAGMEDLNTSSYVLSDDNQVYQNSYGSSSLLPPPKLIQMECLFSAVGLTVGLLVVFRVMSINKRRNTHKTKSG